jgi:hypothetical protein
MNLFGRFKAFLKRHNRPIESANSIYYDPTKQKASNPNAQLLFDIAMDQIQGLKEAQRCDKMANFILNLTALKSFGGLSSFPMQGAMTHLSQSISLKDVRDFVLHLISTQHLSHPFGAQFDLNLGSNDQASVLSGLQIVAEKIRNREYMVYTKPFSEN